MRDSKIEWTDHTFNPWIGCTKVSPACDGCYAEHLMDARLGRAKWGPGEDRKRTSEAYWRQPLAWNKAAKGRTFVFCASLADVFDNEAEDLWRADLFRLIETTPKLTWLLLTKRIGNVIRMTDPLTSGLVVPQNIAIGATMANQDEYDRDKGKLAEVKRVVGPLFTFGSFEPLLGLVVLDREAPDWVIVGGETDQGAHKARVAKTEWFRSMRDQSAALGRAFFFKQMPRKAPIPVDLLVRQFPEAA